MTDQSPTLTALAKLSSAEDIFAFLGLEPNLEVLHPARLHIMKRFGAYLRETDFAGQPEAEVVAQCRTALARAQDDFGTSSSLAEKVFKVFETQAARQKSRFVGLDTIKIAKTFAAAPDPVAEIPSIFNVLSSFLDLRHGVLALLAEPGEAARTVFRSGVPFVSFDLATEFGAEAVPRRLRDAGQTLIAVPLRDPGRSHFVLGVLAAYRSHDHTRSGFSDADVRVLTMVASLLEQVLRFRRRVARDRERALEDTRRALQTASEARGHAPPVSLEGIVGDRPAIAEVVAQIKRVAATRMPVLLRGESGTGKELFARAVHAQSPRAKGAFIRVKCAVLSETLLESELFGHEKGAFTGANALKKGRFELADGGTWFLDEIGEISNAFQSKLLRVLQEGEFERVIKRPRPARPSG